MSQSVSRKATSGVAWLYAEYGIQFVCQAVALIVLARLLSPEDFGVFAIGLMMVGIGETVFRMGLGPSIVQRKGSVDGYLEVAFTANLAISLVAFAVLATLTPWVSGTIFRAPEATLATIVMLLGVPLSSCGNPVGMLLLKEMRYRQLFVIGLPRNVIRYAGAPIVALWIPSYWAMVWAYLAGFIGEVLLSYLLLPNRARLLWNAAYIRELYRFSGWLQLNNLVKWLSRYLDSFVVGNTLGAASLGLYNRATTLAGLPAQQVNMVLFKVGFPLFASLQDDRRQTGRLATHLLDLATLTYFPVILAVLLFGEELVGLVLGPEWLALVPAMQVLVVALYLRTLADVLITVLRSNGHSRLEFTNNALRIVVTAAALFPFARAWGMAGAALAVLLGSAVALPSVLFWSARTLALNWTHVVGSVALTGALLGAGALAATPLDGLVGGDLVKAALALLVVLAVAVLVLAASYRWLRIGPFGAVFLALNALKQRLKPAPASAAVN